MTQRSQFIALKKTINLVFKFKKYHKTQSNILKKDEKYKSFTWQSDLATIIDNLISLIHCSYYLIYSA